MLIIALKWTEAKQSDVLFTYLQMRRLVWTNCPKNAQGLLQRLSWEDGMPIPVFFTLAIWSGPSLFAYSHKVDTNIVNK